jgi:hypothetical protein
MSTLDFSSASYRLTEQFSAFELLHHAANLSCTNTKENCYGNPHPRNDINQ